MYTRPDGQEVRGRAWDADTRYRYGLLLAGIDAPPGWRQDWFPYIGDLVWYFEPQHVQDWAAYLTNVDGTPLVAASRGRAVSALRSFYAHCEDHLGAARWNLPRAAYSPGPPRRPLPRPPPRTRPPRRLHDARRAAPGPVHDRRRPAHPARNQAGPAWRLPAKDNGSSAVATLTSVPRPVVWALDEYLPVRTHKAPHSGPEHGPLLLFRTGGGLDRVTFPKLLRDVAVTHPDLTEIAPTLLPDAVAHSPTPLADETGPPSTDSEGGR
ncbi:hypothetical protein [Streptomyces europaeiscabiei]|uniref:hypothetical protein n=1 Tax=Streptomyces europaeiscabiei TaxID=146819 RepID=UPI000765D624|nr:hypothetical protein [Streptomyces europaeiscabiei]